MSPRSIATIIIEPHIMVREGLTSLITNYSYRVVGSFSSAQDIRDPTFAEAGQKLVILGAQVVSRAVSEAALIRSLWPDSKIVLLFEQLSDDDFQKLSTSTINGCVPFYASHDILIRALDLVISDEARVMIITEAAPGSIPAEVSEGDSSPLINGDSEKPSSLKERSASGIYITPQISLDDDAHTANGHTSSNGNGTSTEPECAIAIVASDDATPHLGRPRNYPRLSGRESQILDSLVKGYANKMIARRCEITEATVKVHMKSILRKIQVANRTQAAIWALEQGYTANDINQRLLKASD
jgi:two-component system nitrate/nitrite response regulator NarL